MSLPILKILWAPTNRAHYNHLHVEGDPTFGGTPPLNNPGMSPAVQVIYQALKDRFGTPAYFQDAGDADWTHMGWYNRRLIAGTTTWSQHSWSNAIDIGPYYGVAEQQKFYDFLTGKEEEMTPEQEAKLDKVLEVLLSPSGKIPLGAADGPTPRQAWLDAAEGAGLSEAQVRQVVREELNKTKFTN